jgi:hypothetical protein
LVTELDIGSAPFVADPAQLEAAILNICINARDAQPRGGELRLRIAPVTIIEGADETWPPPGRYTTITVTDHGTGMDPATRAHAFEPFFTTKPVGKGTGLGLSMVKGFARQSGGHVAIDTAPGRGTSVTLYMPVAAGAIASTAPQPSPTPAILPPIEVLLVEDQDDVQGGVKFGLMFASVERGCGMNGADLAAAAQKLQPDLPVLLTSGSGDHAPTGLHLLEKPYARDALIAAVQRAIAAPRRI